MLLPSMLMILTPCLPATQSADNQEHALVLAETEEQQELIPEAARFADEKQLNPVTLEELNAFIATERSKDLRGCAGVACYTEVAGALDIRYVVRIAPHDTANTATLSLYSLFPAPQKLDDKVVSCETATEALLRSFAEYKQRRNALASLLRKIPCGFPWSELRPAIGKPHFHNRYQLARWGKTFEYFDLAIFVSDDKITKATSRFGFGPFLVSCY